MATEIPKEFTIDVTDLHPGQSIKIEDMNVEVEMVLYPNAGHGINAPKQFSNLFKRWIDWYKKYLQD